MLIIINNSRPSKPWQLFIFHFEYCTLHALLLLFHLYSCSPALKEGQWLVTQTIQLSLLIHFQRKRPRSCLTRHLLRLWSREESPVLSRYVTLGWSMYIHSWVAVPCSGKFSTSKFCRFPLELPNNKSSPRNVLLPCNILFYSTKWITQCDNLYLLCFYAGHLSQSAMYKWWRLQTITLHLHVYYT